MLFRAAGATARHVRRMPAVGRRLFSTSAAKQTKADAGGLSMLVAASGAVSACVALNAWLVAPDETPSVVHQHGAAHHHPVSEEQEDAGEPLTLECLSDPRRKLKFAGAPAKIMAWLKDGEHYVRAVSGPTGQQLLKVNARTGESVPLYDMDKIKAAFESLPEVSSKQADLLVSKGRFKFSPDEKATFIAHGKSLYYYRFEDDAASLLVRRSAGKLAEPSFSPDGTRVAYVADRDLYVVDVRSGDTACLTTGGKDNENTFNGLLDWVYQEEIYGRGDFKGYWWSPDSTSLAMLRLDETPVPSFTVVDHLPQHLTLETTRYPKSGDPNPTARLCVLPADPTASTPPTPRWIDTSAYKPEELLLVRVGWTPDSKHVVFQAQNKDQTWLDLNLGDAKDGSVCRIFRECNPPPPYSTSPKGKDGGNGNGITSSGPGVRPWVNVLMEPEWLDDGSFVWLSERTGFSHLYHYQCDGKGGRTRTALTSGDWEVRSVHGMDKQRGLVFVSATKDGDTESHVYSVPVHGKSGEMKRLTHEAGTHSPSFNEQFTLFVNTFSNICTPPLKTLRAASDGSVLRDVAPDRAGSEEDVAKVAAHMRGLAEPEFRTIPTRDGFPMEAYVLKPPGFDPQTEYPVLLYQYSGPHHPQVRNVWLGNTLLWHHYIAQQGYVVWCVDCRTASGKGAVSAWPVHRNFGELELRDLEDAARHMQQEPWVDANRMGLWGWSYGGYMTLYTLTHSKLFKMGIAGAPVTDWKLYDTIYTERYMSTPQSNPEGYKRSSVLPVAKDLHGKLLLIHGTMDDNVHMQQSVQFLQELQRANKHIDLMLYPKARHGVTNAAAVHHLRTMMTDFVQKNL